MHLEPSKNSTSSHLHPSEVSFKLDAHFEQTSNPFLFEHVSQPSIEQTFASETSCSSYLLLVRRSSQTIQGRFLSPLGFSGVEIYSLVSANPDSHLRHDSYSWPLD